MGTTDRIKEALTELTIPIHHLDEELSIHFVHHRSERLDTLPLLFLHGWPGSFLQIRPRPTSRQFMSLHLLYPDMVFRPTQQNPAAPWIWPGRDQPKAYASPGLREVYCPRRRLGLNDRSDDTHQPPRELPAIHVNMVEAMTPSPLRRPLVLAGAVLAFTTGLGIGAYAKKLLKRMRWWIDHENGYSAIQGTKPQTLAYGLTGSPFGMMCWLREKMQFQVGDDFK
ncbi:hypothetical protein GQ53DRAFT_838466 [Thozetella sp. PMI_491]|nr:hypothetical protein GQ53DRAFT_838466 [Thozetella sp. PMI_491]